MKMKGEQASVPPHFRINSPIERIDARLIRILIISYHPKGGGRTLEEREVCSLQVPEREAAVVGLP